MQVYNISHAKTQLSALIARVEKGEEIIIGRADKPLAKIVPYYPDAKPGFLGAARGRIRVPEQQSIMASFAQTPPVASIDLFSDAA